MEERLKVIPETQLDTTETEEMIAIGLLGQSETAVCVTNQNGSRAVLLGGNRHIIQESGQQLEECVVIPWGGL